MEEEFFERRYLENVDACPVCGSRQSQVVYEVGGGVMAQKCACGGYYCDHRLNPEGLSAYWQDYQNREHCAVEAECAQRQRMYAVDYAYIAQFLKPGARVLDVGCADGLFLDWFAAAGHECHGVEFGHEAALKAAQRYPVQEGYFPDLDIAPGYDLIIFRGVLQYVHTPRRFFSKAASLLAPGGHVYVTAQPNMEAYCHQVFRKRFRFSLTPCDCVGYTPQSLAGEFAALGCSTVGQTFFYEETPYANPACDIQAVSRAVEAINRGQEPLEPSPPFWGNMMTMVFRKN
ncbi:class I SAM-dependent methyltransferase [uncultured Desulfovibrio sp.]|uniref:class I SAM-dependent methyltransferase n=1 Tax=uncultured Desulfovibrio sp. TaxID=167968 RepID=UPI0026371DCF|nr:class I SAM-dependent methyltransferase [uncultured Desulfovibrio sp.]